MGRELQKRKNRSSISKVRQKPKSKKRILSNPIIAANWDKDQTLAQNYKRLGLTARVNKITGGIERKVSDVSCEVDDETDANIKDTLNITNSSKRGEKLDITEAKIERDPETGRILRVFDGSETRSNPLKDGLNELDSDSDDGLYSLENQHGNTDRRAEKASTTDSAGKTETIRELEKEANKPVMKYKRKQPEGERVFVEELVRKYGDDYEKMARDMKINYMQRSAGDLKKRIKKWRESGGTID